MAYDELLAERVRTLLEPHAELTEREMFGGICFMLAGNMALGVIGGDLLVRLGQEDGERALAEPHVRPMDFTGRPMKSTVYVGAEGTAADGDLAGWVEAGAAFAETLPPKEKG